MLGDYGGVVSLGAASDDSAYENGFIPQSVWPQFLKKQGGVTDIVPIPSFFPIWQPPG